MRASVIASALIVTGIPLFAQSAAPLHLNTIALTATPSGFTLVTEGRTYENLRIGYTFTVAPETGTPQTVSGGFPVNYPGDLITGYGFDFRKSYTGAWGFAISGKAAVTGRVELQYPDGTIVNWEDTLQYKEITDPVRFSSIGVEEAVLPRIEEVSCAPNPFNPATAISFTLSGTMRVSVTIYDSRGAHLATLADRVFPAGQHTLDWNAAAFGSGLYFCRVRTGKNTASTKLMLLK